MGGRGAYQSAGGFKHGYTYRTVDYLCGYKILKYYDPKKPNKGLPEYSNTAEAYIKIDTEGNLVQIRVYNDRKPVIDIDLEHQHHHGLKDGEAHVHEFTTGKDGHPSRPHASRPMTEAEHAKWGKVIQKIKEYNNEH